MTIPKPKAKSPTSAEIKDQIKALQDQLRDATAEERKRQAEHDKKKAEIVGTLILKKMAAEPEGGLSAEVRELLNTGVTRPADRSLFDLPPLAKAGASHPVVEAPQRKGAHAKAGTK